MPLVRETRLRGFGERYWVSGGDAYVRITFALAHNGRHEETDLIDRAMRTLDKESIDYRPPEFNGNIFELGSTNKIPKHSISKDLIARDPDVETATTLLEHYGFEVEKQPAERA